MCELHFYANETQVISSRGKYSQTKLTENLFIFYLSLKLYNMSDPVGRKKAFGIRTPALKSYMARFRLVHFS